MSCRASLDTRLDLRTLQTLLEEEEGFEVLFRVERGVVEVSELDPKLIQEWAENAITEVESDLKLKRELAEDAKHQSEKLILNLELIQQLLYELRDDPTTGRLLNFNNRAEEIHLHVNWRKGLYYDSLLIPDIPRIADIRINCLVAKKGPNLVKCIQLDVGKDPVITVSGPEAAALKDRLELRIRRAEAAIEPGRLFR